jgi:hypothetical protein
MPLTILSKENGQAEVEMKKEGLEQPRQGTPESSGNLDLSLPCYSLPTTTLHWLLNNTYFVRRDLYCRGTRILLLVLIAVYTL